MSTRTTEQKRAEYAWARVAEAEAALDQRKRKMYAGRAKSAPVMVMTNGLGQTLAFMRSKGDPDWKLLCTHIEKWLSETVKGVEKTDVIQSLTKLDSSRYRVASMEAVALLMWIKRLAVGKFGEPEDQE